MNEWQLFNRMRTKEDSTSDVATDSTLNLIRSLIRMLMNPAWVDKTQNRMRATVAIESGTVTTVTTVTGMTNIDSQQGRIMVLPIAVNAWANLVRSRF